MPLAEREFIANTISNCVNNTKVYFIYTQNFSCLYIASKSENFYPFFLKNAAKFQKFPIMLMLLFMKLG